MTGPVFLALLVFLAAHMVLSRIAYGGEKRRTKTTRARPNAYPIDYNGAAWGSFHLPLLVAGSPPDVEIREVEDGWRHIRATWTLPKSLDIDEVAIAFCLSRSPDLWWAPHLAPEKGNVIAQHVFRSPAIIVAEGTQILIMTPDLSLCGKMDTAPWFMDLDATANTFWLGVSQTKVSGHVGFSKVPGLTLPPGKLELAFYYVAYEDTNTPLNPWGKVSKFLWNRYGHSRAQRGEPTTVPMDQYVGRVYDWAFDTWQDAVWQEFDINGTRVGAPAFIVNTTQSPNYPGQENLREFLSVWNQVWFSSLRSASGVMRYARRTNSDELRERARLTKEFALAAPMHKGIFPSVYRTRMENVEIDGKKYKRSKGWETGYWTNSNRVPWERGITDECFHILDASWTCLLMLRWHREIEEDPRLLDYATRYAEKLLTLQNDQGFFPAWLHPGTFEPSEVLHSSAESAMSATFLLTLAGMTGRQQYREAALKALDAVIREVIRSGRWEDFETYWSCSEFGRTEYYGKRLPRNAMYKQNTFSMFWTAEALLEAYRATGEDKYLDWGRRTIDELSMAQQTWQPPFIHVPALGGFGVMNFDAEWNDSRQSLFAELFMQYYTETGDWILFERGIAALKASFVMMYCPENPGSKELWESVWPFFGPDDYGFTMENYGHSGRTSIAGEGIGSFTIYDWGNGAAAEARNRIYDHFGDVYVDRMRNHAFGIDSIAVETTENGFALHNLSKAPRNIKIVFDDGSAMIQLLDRQLDLNLKREPEPESQACQD